MAFERLQQMLSIDKEKTGTEEDDICAGEVNVENLSFQYGTRKHIIKGRSFSIHKNEKIAIVGESGSGKTTLARLLLGFYDVRRGSIKFGDKDICDINKKVLRKKIAYVSQEPYFFKGTLQENATNLSGGQRLSAIKRCDRIFAICDGKIKEAGTHDELIHKKGFYYSLWKEQL